MIFSHYKVQLKYIIWILFWIWVVLTTHLFYLYVYENSEKLPAKWWTFVEAWTEKIYYLPYTSNSDFDKFYQNFLFNSCLKPFISWTEIVYKSDLCKIETQNWKTFKVYLNKQIYWSDWAPVSLDDVYFTYKKILQENVRNVKYLNQYKSVKIERKNDYLLVDFPIPSKDNLIFFTNFILPEHILENKNLDWYITKFWFNPVVSNCWKIKLNSKDLNSIIFDLSKCDTYIQNYQYKYFTDFDNLKNYILSKRKKIIDYYISDNAISWYKNEKVILNNYIAIFFNSKSSNIDFLFKKSFINDLYKKIVRENQTSYFVKVMDFFKYNFSNDTLPEYIKVKIKQLKKTINSEGNQITSLPEKVVLQEDRNLSYYLWKNLNKSKYKLNFVLPYWCDKVGVSYNSWSIYWLRLYKRKSKTASYNISEAFHNIQKWKNVYKLVCIKGSKEKDFYLTIWRLEKPVLTHKEKKQNVDFKVKIIYFDDYAIDYLISKIKEYLTSNWLEKYFLIKWYKNIDKFNWVIQAGDYDVAIRGVYLGLKRDIWNLFFTDNPLLNPSRYKNWELANLYSQYLIAEWKTKEILEENANKVYNQTLPVVFFAKYLWNYYQRTELKDPIFSKRLYNFWFRKDYIKNIKIFYQPKFDYKKLFNFKNFIDWIKKKI